MDVNENGVGLLGLGVLLGLAGSLVDDNVAVLILEGLAALGVDDVFQSLGVELAGSALAGGIGQADAGVAADIVVEAQILSGLAHDLAIAVSGDTGSLVLGVHDVQIESCSQLAGELGAGPAHQLAFLLGNACVGVDVIHNLAQSQDTGADAGLLSRLGGGCGFCNFCHVCILHS